MLKSEKSHAVLGKSYGHIKAKKILTVLNEFTNINERHVLDIGTGGGYIIHNISKQSKSASSVDLNDERIIKSGYLFKKVIDERLPFNNKTFDVVISNHIIEHVQNQKLHISEIHRVLKNDGILYLATPNKFWLFDPHYNLPFISWFPRIISNFLLKLIKNKTWDIFPLSFSGLRKLTEKKFKLYNMTADVFKYPEKFHLDIYNKIQPLIKMIPLPFMKFLNYFPTYIIVLRKK